MHNNGLDNSIEKVPEIKLIAWLFYDITVIGTGAYALLNTFMEHVDALEKILIFCAFIIMAGYRIYILHLDAEKKKLNNDELKSEVKQKKIELQERENKLKRG